MSHLVSSLVAYTIRCCVMILASFDVPKKNIVLILLAMYARAKKKKKKEKKETSFLSNSIRFRSSKKENSSPSEITRKKNDSIQDEDVDEEDSLILKIVNAESEIPLKFGEKGGKKEIYFVGLLVCSNRHLESLPSHGTKRFPFSLDCETIFYRGALALRIYYICNGLRKLRQSANISHDLHLHDSPFLRAII